ncbi:RNA polymerase factor sigma-54 [Sediminibacillus massiliensis]|uniref:RNA polymerase factor sigma-54 n=1 Tax=Sediminibacillus massiliensis TaxID=1926277 RepID=UPI00098865CF|nr:RNA polymerase factor sigma-54 [Sediminibacillus massiliensis]
MELGLVQEQKIRLSMTTELQQAISLLQYSSLQLAEFIQDQSLENPFIELEETNSNHTYDRPPRSTNNISQYTNPIDYINNDSYTLSQHLLNQLSFLKISKKEHRIMNYIILMLNSKGYFEESLESTAEHLRVAKEEVAGCLKKIQQLDPIGVGARNLIDCLLIQLNHFHPQEKVAEEIIKNYFLQFAEKNQKFIERKLAVTNKDIDHAYSIIKSLNPRPAANIEKFKPTYITPDVNVSFQKGNIVIRINDHTLPKIKMNEEYHHYLSTLNKKSEASIYLQNKYKNFRWLIQSIERRKITLVKIMKAITEKQYNFFRKGPFFLDPLTLKEIAEVCGVHESTVSRATTNKFVQTPFGIFEMKYFFSSALKLKNGTEASSHLIKKMISEMIAAESVRKPLSDQAITSQLQQQDICVSRRTVAKYRVQMNIPPSSKRKDVFKKTGVSGLP